MIISPLKRTWPFIWTNLNPLHPRIIRAPLTSGCPIVISLSVHASVHLKWCFPGFFSTPFHLGSWNFPWGSFLLSYTSSSRFIVVTPMVPELRALTFSTIGHMHVTVFRVFFSTPFNARTWNFPWGSSQLSYTSSSCFTSMTPMVSELSALGGHMHVTVFHHQKRGP